MFKQLGLFLRLSLIGLFFTLFSSVAMSETVLRVVPHADLKVLDPIWTTAYITRNHGYMIYDTLFSMDANLKPQPQMVDHYTVSKDRLTWTFVLRKGLKWHDGTPVTAKDCVASLERWGKRDGMGQLLLSAIKSLEAKSEDTFVMTLSKPYGLVLESLAKPDTSVPFMMPERVAKTDPFKQITDYTGSGPFIFKKDEWVPGSKVVYVKNPAYVPRKEPASFLAGGKVVKVDRVEWIITQDKNTALNALTSGEVDFIDLLPSSLIPLVSSNPNIVVDIKKASYMGILRFNSLIPPFNNPKIRRAAIMAINQKNFMAAAAGDPKYWRECFSVYLCGYSPLTNNAGADIFGANNLEKAKALLKEAHYDGTPVVILQPADLQDLSSMALLAADSLRKIGMKVELLPLDWASITVRRANRGPVSEGGWNALTTAFSWMALSNPTATLFSGDPEKGWFGWVSDKKLEDLRSAYTKTSDFAQQKALAYQVQLQLAEIGAFGLLGQYSYPNVYSNKLTGVISAPLPIFWNIEKH